MKTKTLKTENQTPKLETAKTFIVTLLLIFVTQFSFAQTVHTVDNRPESGAMYTTVQPAIDAAVAGDIIQIHPSPTGYGNFNVSRASLTIIGLGHNPANADGLRATVSLITLFTSGTNSIITGLNIGNISGFCDGVQIINNRITGSVSGSGTAGQADDWVIEGNYLIGSSSGTRIVVSAGNNWFISNNWIEGRFSSMNNTTAIINNIIYNDNTGTPSIFISSNSPVVANNIFLFASTATGVGLSSSTINFQNCMTYSYAGITLSPLGDGTGGNIDNIDPLFTNVPVNSITDFYNNDYSLTAGSPGAGAGTDVTDLGLYGRLFNFDPNGRPDLSPYPTLLNITNTVIAPGQNLNVDFKASIKQ